MRTISLVKGLVASFVLSACASGPAFDVTPRNVAAPGMWQARHMYVVIPTRELPVVDTTAQREALRRVPHGADHGHLVNGQR